ncbi:DUF3795 domain-containing protein [Candidatus Margulisiibacteriota bacterium]
MKQWYETLFENYARKYDKEPFTKGTLGEMIKKNLIAPCGMNCCLCIAYLRNKNKCPGCREQSKPESNSKYCRKCIIKNCPIIQKNNWSYCSTKCPKFPCRRLKQLDLRYKTKYEMSMIENLSYIEENGIRRFLKKEKEKWQKDDMIYCVHRKEYMEVPEFKNH